MVKAKKKFSYCLLWLFTIISMFYLGRSYEIRYYFVDFFGDGAEFHKDFTSDTPIVVSEVESFIIKKDRVYLIKNQELITFNLETHIVNSYNLFLENKGLIEFHRQQHEDNEYSKKILIHKGIKNIPQAEKAIYDYLQIHRTSLWLPYLNILESKYY
ncbi:hypothetical protein [Veillonella sp. R32]|uniref:hypothetical protein n=1 Tax=Veillonella sp. R32 TaxID=2021312 RepID=UPI00138A088D|nr:hypothetical protein [Veillonella sp. R32]KAF1682651.1 hypothetical protein VER_04770 [Veillonella sp. R32]